MPKSFSAIQDLLVSIDKESLSDSDIHVELSLLNGYLRIEKYSYWDISDFHMLKSAISQFAEAFPNWQHEYSVIHTAIESGFSKNVTKEQAEDLANRLIERYPNDVFVVEHRKLEGENADNWVVKKKV